MFNALLHMHIKGNLTAAEHRSPITAATMLAAKYLLLLCITSMFSSSTGGGCTRWTDWQRSTIEEMHAHLRLNTDVQFECDCAERAEGIAWVESINGRTDSYSNIYYVFTTKLNSTPLHNPYDQVRCMFDKLRNEKMPQMKRIIDRTNNVKFYGCAYATASRKTLDANGKVSQALTCIYDYTGGRCSR
ncbi:hypothetical protein Q1695_015884 [Nippostrongylus brasiliensis]|nr:hypothetical protein Q1695_015884 [Nippostrongylus brasiliensis]